MADTETRSSPGTAKADPQEAYSPPSEAGTWTEAGPGTGGGGLSAAGELGGADGRDVGTAEEKDVPLPAGLDRHASVPERTVDKKIEPGAPPERREPGRPRK